MEYHKYSMVALVLAAFATVASDANAQSCTGPVSECRIVTCNKTGSCYSFNNSGASGAIGINSSSANGIGVRGASDNDSGVYGLSFSASGLSGGSTNGYGAVGLSSLNVGVYGRTLSSQSSGVYGESGATGHGVHGYSQSGRGTVGQSTGTGIGIYGVNTNANGYAGYFDGRVHVAGNLSKASGSFAIDHPLDRENKILRHSFVESPDMKNVYDGIAVVGNGGDVWVSLPGYFSALNKEFRYQLTGIGNASVVYVADEIRDNKFRIAGGKPGMKVSWQVTGIRKDAWAEDKRIVVEEEKKYEDRGRYLYARKGEAPMVAFQQ